MELQLDSLIDKIKTHGIEKGRESADTLVSEAKQESENIINKAKVDATNIIESAKQESSRLLQSGKDGLKQAERDLLMSVEGKLKDLCTKYVSSVTTEMLTAQSLLELIKTALSNWNVETNESVFVHISSNDANTITKQAITGVLQNNIEVKVDNSIANGFRISKGSSGYAFDFTGNAINEALAVFLTPNVQELLR